MHEFSRLTHWLLCTGYGGLDIAVQAVFAGRLVWCVDNDKHVSAILAVRYPGVPNQSPQVQLFRRGVCRQRCEAMRPATSPGRVAIRCGVAAVEDAPQRAWTPRAPAASAH